MENMVTGTNNTAVGQGAMYSATSNKNVAIGWNALYNSAADFNTASWITSWTSFINWN